MWNVAATPNEENPEEEDFFVCPKNWIVNRVLYWPPASDLPKNTMSRAKEIRRMMKSTVIPGKNWDVIRNFRLVKNSKVFLTYQAAEKCETQEVTKQKITTCEESEDNDDDEDDSETNIGVNHKFSKKAANKKKDEVDLNSMVNTSTNSQTVTYTIVDSPINGNSQNNICEEILEDIYSDLGGSPENIYSEKTQDSHSISGPIIKNQTYSETIFNQVNTFHDNEDSQTLNTTANVVTITADKNMIPNNFSDHIPTINLQDILSQLVVGIQAHDNPSAAQLPSVMTTNSIDEDIKQIKETLLFLHNDIKAIGTNMNRLVNTLYRPITNRENPLYDFPIKTNAELKSFDSKLGAEVDFFNEIKVFFTEKYIRAEEGCKSVHYVLKAWVSDELLQEYSLKGIRDKKAFERLENVLKCIIQMFELGTFLKKFDHQVAEKSIKEEISNWLKHASTRLTAKKKKSERILLDKE
ncbi:hypothetical protein ACFFRR_009651 [Megaselia abdita]